MESAWESPNLSFIWTFLFKKGSLTSPHLLILSIDKVKCRHAEAGKGGITLRDLQRMAYTHDFTWSDKEMADMIHCFDSDGDGKVNTGTSFLFNFVPL